MGICNDVHFSVIEELVDHGTDQHFVGSGGADSGGADHVACDISIKAADLILPSSSNPASYSLCQVGLVPAILSLGFKF